MARIEHVNLYVRDADRTAALMERLFGWHVRWSGITQNGSRVVHVGSEHDYLALCSERNHAYSDDDFLKGRPLNHVGIEVEDLKTAETKVVEEGLVPFSYGDYAPGRRFYFLDPDGTEYEVVSYR
jgi:catechol 2,3-dioxygenase-like lactoylglutathione lyase family enzyme